MGILAGQVVHLHTTGTTCENVVCLVDDSTDYSKVVTGNLLTRGLLGVLDSAPRDDLDYYSSTPEDTDRWHFTQECPY